MSLSREVQPLRGRASHCDDWKAYISALVVEITTPPRDVEQRIVTREVDDGRDDREFFRHIPKHGDNEFEGIFEFLELAGS